MVPLSKARCADPLAEGIERYVGLEHLEPGDLRIRSWGNAAVMEAKDAQVLLPELLPFIYQTDAFFDHTVGTSAGSPSPRTN